MRSPHLTLLLAWLALGFVPGSASATDLIVGGEFAVEWDDNVLSRPADELEDFTLRYGPRLELDESEGRFRFNAQYNPDYQDFMDLNEFDGWDHEAQLNVDWDIGRNTTLNFAEQYLDVSRFTRLIGEDPTSPVDVPLISLDRQGIKRNRASIGIDHAPAARHLLHFDLANTDSDFEGDRADTDFWSVRVDHTYLYSARTRVGWNLSAQQQEVTRPDIDPVTTRYYNLSFLWAHDFDPTLSVSLSAGPAYIDRDTNENVIVSMGEQLYPLQRSAGRLGPVAVSTCPTLDDGTPILAPTCDEIPLGFFPDRSFLAETTDVMLVGGFPDESTTDITYFAAASIRKEWTPNFETSLRYSRSAVTSGGQGGEVRDLVLGIAHWRPLQRVWVSFTLSWENREQATGGVAFVRSLTADTVQGISDVGRQAGLRAVATDRDIKNIRYTATLSLRYQVTQQAQLFSRMFWYEQKIEDSAFATSRTTTRFRIVFGVNYFFEPIGLPI